MEQSIAALLCLGLVVLLSNVVGVTAGFGASVIAVSLGAQILPMGVLIPILVPLNLSISAYVAWRYRHLVDGRLLWGWIVPVSGSGLVVGMFLFHRVVPSYLILLYGFFIVAIASADLKRVYVGRPAAPLSTWQANLSLLAGGVMHGLFASGGPLVVHMANRRGLSKGALRATLATLWSVLNFAMVVSLMGTNKLNGQTLSISATLLPSVLLGIFAGEKLHGRISEQRFRLVVYALLVVAGIALVGKFLSQLPR